MIAEKVLEIAKKEKVTSLAHGCSGKGNDQVRFDITLRSGSDLPIIAPIRDKNLDRDTELEFAKKHGIEIDAVAKKFSIDKIITANKVRDMKTGNILRTEIPVLDQHDNIQYVIIDDICDGGRTFVELAKAIKEGRPTAKIYLVVTHGIFSAGYSQLGEYFERIYTTNSYKGIGETEFHGSELQQTKVKQFNIFK